MKHTYNIIQKMARASILLFSLMLVSAWVFGQDNPPAEEKEAKPVKKYVKNTFESNWLIDNQSVMVPIKGTFEMDIMHRFGTLENGYGDFFGFFAPSNIRLGFNYTPIDNLMAGISLTKTKMTLEGYAKYAILKQTKGNEYPVSITYFVDMAYETGSKDAYINFSDRLSYFHQLIIARKISDRLSVQVAPSISHYNFVYGDFVDSTVDKSGRIQERKHDHIAINVGARFKIKESMNLIANYDQPITKHRLDNPHPNLSLGIELTTSAHAFQIFVGNYSYITPQRNNYFNQNKGLEFHDGNLTLGKQFLIGFNITRLWNY